MKTSVFFVLIGIVSLSACTSRKIDRLSAQNDSLRLELEKAQSIIRTFSAINASLDSLDGLRNVVAAHGKHDAPHAAMASRIHAINQHVVETDKKVSSLDKQLRSSRHENSAYVMMVDALKNELQIRVDEVTILEGNIADVEQANEEVKWEKEQAVTKLLAEVATKKIELTGLEDRLHKLEVTFRDTEAEAVYARAVAVEQSARKTRFAPARKKESLNEALELYKKAKALGKAEAEVNIRALEKSESARSMAVSSNSDTNGRVF
ncbi:MAG TPA: hypothetical protein VGD65_25560 [Chryseosolibacter sp.]